MSVAKPDFEQQLSELDAIVARLENNELPLEESMQQYEKGVNIAKQCQQALQNATQRLEKLSTNTNQIEPWDINADSST